ncbi:hypothetical protein E9531_12065 [Lampropedia puyangensis]|uniref:DUF4124 domain-containing protein n=1 Tax=Lampropedia puyangensis TaxID=1330072 RepID=A0A4S8EXR1_9BURK|nr:hypothetical protein [Lampropedia puyangensis]THT99679.1 hypothetical protein E9531_12065 [Lampropedia puyangensis]
MKKISLGILFLATWCASVGHAQEKVYRCGNEYTNATGAAKRQGCRAVEGGNVTVIQGSSPAPVSRAPANSTAPKQASSATAAPRVANTAQRDRDADARTILEAELRKSQERLTALQEEYNGGTPVRTALELRNPQGYAERTAEIKANMERAEADIEGIQREINRLR